MARPKTLPAPQDAKEFERLCTNVWRRITGDRNLCAYGRDGQSQNGVDLIGQRSQPWGWIGIQCKVRTSGQLDVRDLARDVASASKLNPQLSEFSLATSAPRDTRLQDWARQKTDEHRDTGSFSVQVQFWEDIEEFLLDPLHLDVLALYYPNFIVRVMPRGATVSKLVSLQIGDGRALTTLYELVIGRLPTGAPAEDTAFGIAYFKNLAFLMNLQNKRCATFQFPPRHHTDLEAVIPSRHDQKLITQWLCTFPTIQAAIEGIREEATFRVSVE